MALGTKKLLQVVFHESGHFSHAKKVNALYWAKNVSATMANYIATLDFSFDNTDPYSDGTKPSLQAGDRISVVEGWGNFTEYKVTSQIYGGAYVFDNFRPAFGFESVDNNMENFDMYQRPMTAQRNDFSGWFLNGLMWDLLDDRNEITPETFFSQYLSGNGQTQINLITDNCTLTAGGNLDVFNLAPIFNALNSNVENGCDLYWSLRNQNPNAVLDFNELFNSYGINCL